MEFESAVKLVSMAASKDRALTTLNCVHHVENVVFASDKLRLYAFKVSEVGNCLIPTKYTNIQDIEGRTSPDFSCVYPRKYNYVVQKINSEDFLNACKVMFSGLVDYANSHNIRRSDIMRAIKVVFEENRVVFSSFDPDINNITSHVISGSFSPAIMRINVEFLKDAIAFIKKAGCRDVYLTITSNEYSPYIFTDKKPESLENIKELYPQALVMGIQETKYGNKKRGAYK